MASICAVGYISRSVCPRKFGQQGDIIQFLWSLECCDDKHYTLHLGKEYQRVLSTDMSVSVISTIHQQWHTVVMVHQWDIYIPTPQSIMGLVLSLHVLKAKGHGRQQLGDTPGYCILGKWYLSTNHYQYRSPC